MFCFLCCSLWDPFFSAMEMSDAVERGGEWEIAKPSLGGFGTRSGHGIPLVINDALTVIIMDAVTLDDRLLKTVSNVPKTLMSAIVYSWVMSDGRSNHQPLGPLLWYCGVLWRGMAAVMAVGGGVDLSVSLS